MVTTSLPLLAISGTTSAAGVSHEMRPSPTSSQIAPAVKPLVHENMT